MNNKIYFGDNLPILEKMESEFVDLIYIDQARSGRENRSPPELSPRNGLLKQLGMTMETEEDFKETHIELLNWAPKLMKTLLIH